MYESPFTAELALGGYLIFSDEKKKNRLLSTGL
jgi:hypothetical protein